MGAEVASTPPCAFGPEGAFGRGSSGVNCDVLARLVLGVALPARSRARGRLLAVPRTAGGDTVVTATTSEKWLHGRLG